MKFLLAFPAYAWLIVSVVFFAVGEYLSKKWALKPGVLGASLAVLAYAIGSLLWLPALLQKNQLVVIGRIWLLLATVSSMGIGLIIFHEKLSATHWAGVALALGALILLSW